MIYKVWIEHKNLRQFTDYFKARNKKELPRIIESWERHFNRYKALNMTISTPKGFVIYSITRE